MPAAAALVCHKPWLSDGRRYGDYLLQFTAAFSANGEVNTLALIHVTRPIFRCSGGLPPFRQNAVPLGSFKQLPGRAEAGKCERDYRLLEAEDRVQRLEA